MSASHHPSEEILLAHAAGGLDEAYRAVIATHLAGCPACRQAVRFAECVGGDVLDAIERAPMAADALDRAMARLDLPEPPPPARPTPPASMPPTLAGYSFGRWRGMAPGLAVATLLPPAGERAGLHLLRIRPGMRLADHGHRGLELTAVLQGAFCDRGRTYRQGDVAETDEDDGHAPIAVGEETCICLIALSGRLQFRHWAFRLLQPLIGF